MKTTLALIFLAAACGTNSGGTTTDASKTSDASKVVDGLKTADARAVDAQVFEDAHIVPPATVHVSGKATYEDANGDDHPLADATVEFRKATDDSVVGTAKSDANGAYGFDITTGGEVVDGYLHGTIASPTGELVGAIDNYVYPAAPIAADFSADISILESGAFSRLVGIVHQTSTSGIVIASMVDKLGVNVTGASISSTPAATYWYDVILFGHSIPDQSKTSTAADGVGMFVNLPTGEVSIGATTGSAKFKTHTVKARAGALTNSTLVEQ